MVELTEDSTKGAAAFVRGETPATMTQNWAKVLQPMLNCDNYPFLDK
jgi:hypothetical protein